MKIFAQCIAFFVKGDFKPQYFTLRIIENIDNLSVQNVLKMSANLRLGVLINFVLIKKSMVQYKISLYLCKVRNTYLTALWRKVY